VRAIPEPSGDKAEEGTDLEALMQRAKGLCSQYAWEEAGALYSKALEHISEDDLMKKAILKESLGYSVHRHAFQAKTPEEFSGRIRSSLETYGAAEKDFKASSDSTAGARAARCRAMQSYLRFWLEPEAAEKRKHVSGAWSQAKTALESFLKTKDYAELGKTCSDAFLAMVLSYDFEPGVAERASMLSDATRYVREAAEHAVEPRQHAENLVQLAGCLEASTTSLPQTPAQHEEAYNRAHAAWLKACEVDEEAAVLESTKADLWFGLDAATCGLQGAPTSGETLRTVCEMQLTAAQKADDRLATGTAKSVRAGLMVWGTARMENPDEFERAVEEIERVSEDVRREFGIISFISPDYFTGHWTSSPSSPWTYAMRSWREMDPQKRRSIASQGLERARQEFPFAQKTGYPYVVASSHWSMGFLLLEVARCEVNPERKRTLLCESVKHHDETIAAEDAYNRSQSWNRGVARVYMAWTEAELAAVTEDLGERIRLLRSSASRTGKGLELCEESYHNLNITYDPDILTMLGLFWRDYGKVLRLCWEHGRDNKDLESACAAFERAAEIQSEVGVFSRAAESYWEAARTYDIAGSHTRASNRFDRAAESYTRASRETKPLKGYFEDYAQYMQGWSEIEKAKHCRSRQEPSPAREHFRKAAEIHASTQRWRWLASNYSAWAQVENGEDLSQKEDSKASIDAFKDAARLFRESKKALLEQLSQITSSDLKQMVTELTQAADDRRDLCEARAVIEAARLLDREVKMTDASERYGQGAEMLQRILGRVTSEQDRKDISLNLTLANAWKAMARAEAETSPELYQEAARLFDEAKDLSPGEKARYLAIGNSRFCKALEAGARFEDTGEQPLYAAAADNLESAARHYMKAGQEKAAEYARASKLLFDAYVQIGVASKESGQEKKAALYAVSEKILEAAANSFEKAGQPGKKAQILRLHERVRRDRELAVSLTQVLRAPEVASASVGFSSPTHEAPVGLDRFEHADIQATMIIRPKDMHVGEDLRLDIELVNAGRGPAQLTKVDGVVPPGFDVQTVPDKYRIEDSYLNMRGRRLGSMKTEDIKLILRPTARGTYVMKPRVLYVDESGKYKSHEAEPVTITVKELGIGGWLKGPERKNQNA